jgi:hypothetical protein
VETNISVAPPSRRSTRLQPEPPVATESRPRRSSQSSQSSECESRPRRSLERESRPRHSPERESRPRRSPEPENIGEYFIIRSPLYWILYTFPYKHFIFIFIFINYISNYVHK